MAITSDEILFLPVFPRRLVIVGAGAIGLEMAGAFSDFGAGVTVIDQERAILPARVEGYDPQLLDMLCFAGEVGWGRLSSPAIDPLNPPRLVPATPIEPGSK